MDRDGVINVERSYTYRLQDFKILPDLMEVLQQLQDNGYLLIIISNQSGVAQGMYAQKDVEILHDFLHQEFKKSNIAITETYYCIHHPSNSNCICRKPDSLFVEKALARFNIDASKSYFIGDKQRDVDAGKAVGVNGILIVLVFVLVILLRF